MKLLFFNSFFWDGRAESLEEQALGPIESKVEMNQNLDELEAELAAIPGYVTEFRNVFRTKPNRDGIAKALAAFQRTLVTEPSPFDRFLSGDKDALSDEAKRGLELFRGNAGCIECHNGPLLSDGKFYRIGVSFKDEGRAKINEEEIPSCYQVSESIPEGHDISAGLKILRILLLDIGCRNAGAENIQRRCDLHTKNLFIPLTMLS